MTTDTNFNRGNWRKESTSAPSLLTKSCHDIDFMLWLFQSPPSTVTSSGSLVYFKRSKKPAAAGDATNCLSCSIQDSCKYSAKKIYVERLRKGDTGWPVKIVVPDIERCLEQGTAEDRLLDALRQDSKGPWFGRCVYESDNDVCDDQTVTITWDDGKKAIFHMVAFTEKICERRSRIYGTNGEIEADSTTIRVHDFDSGQTAVHQPPVAGGGHGGGDSGLALQFVKAIDAVKKGMSVSEAQRTHIGCNLDEIVRSHALVFAAEEARLEKKVVDWSEWWTTHVER
jgi:predicted dehydrogenase